MKKTKLFLILIFIVMHASYAQTFELTGSAGDSFVNDVYQLDWSIGEVAIETYSSEQNILTQGLHQNTYTVLAVGNNNVKIDMSVYPNPTTDLISIEVKNLGTYQLILSDINGKELINKQISATHTLLDLSTFRRSAYFLLIKQQNRLLKTYKIIKQ